MSLIINTNTSSLTAQRFLSKNTTELQKSMERLSSGYRINRAGDDAAGLQVSENLRTQIRGSKKALDNAQDGLNMMSIADGALSVMTENLQRMRELAVQAANDTYSTQQRQAIQAELDQRVADIDRIAQATQFNGVTLLDGGADADGDGAFVLQVGPNSGAAANQIDIINAFNRNNQSGGDLAEIDAANINVLNNALATTSLTNIDLAIQEINSQRATIGSYMNQMQSTMENLMIGIENLSASESRVRNVDVAAESANLTQQQILQQASTAMLGQANQAPQLALQLLQGN